MIRITVNVDGSNAWIFAQKWRDRHDNLARARRMDLAKVEEERDRLRALLSLDGDYSYEIRWRRKDEVKP